MCGNKIASKKWKQYLYELYQDLQNILNKNVKGGWIWCLQNNFRYQEYFGYFGYQENFKYFVTPSCQYLKTGGLLWRVGFQEDQAVPQVEPVLPGNQTQYLVFQECVRMIIKECLVFQECVKMKIKEYLVFQECMRMKIREHLVFQECMRMYQN